MSVPRIEPVTPDLTQENIEKILELFPNVATEVQDPETGEIRKAVDFDALRNQLGDVAEGMRERYRFTWPGKRAAREEAYRPIAKTLRPVKERSKNWDDTQNLYIEGDNLDALKILRETYAGKIKLIYIDPPYNTGHDFIYDDDFFIASNEYKGHSGEYAEEGQLVANPETNGHFHSDWCTMIYPRLILAKDMLASNGIIFISIDDSEVTNLRNICDSVFGVSNFISCITRSTGTPTGGGFDGIVNELDYILVYAKNKKNVVINGLPMTDEDAKIYDKVDEKGRYLIRPLRRTGGEDRREDRPTLYYSLIAPDGARVFPIAPSGYDSRWICSQTKAEELAKSGMLEWKYNEGHWTVYQKFYLENRTKSSGNLWNDINGNKKATRELKSLFDGIKLFDFPKPAELLEKIIRMSTGTESVVLDFFSGSATTAHAVMKLNAEDGGNRKFIMVQLPEVCDEKSEASKAGYHTICEIGEERIRRAGERIKSEVDQENQQLKLDAEPKRVPDIGFRVLRVDSSNYEDARRTPAETTQGALDEFVDVSKSDRESLDKLFECFPTFQLPYDSSIEVLNGPAFADHTVYSVNGGQLVACFDAEISEPVLRGMAALDPKPSYAVVAEAGLKNSQTVTNFEEIFKQSANAQQGSTQTRII